LAWKRKISKKYKIKLLQNSELLGWYKKLLETKNLPAIDLAKVDLIKLLKKRAMRTLSGVSVITVLTKPYQCPGNCLYCPSEPGMPKRYLSNEPAAQRALRLKFNPIRQVQMHVQALENNGNQVDKIRQ